MRRFLPIALFATAACTTMTVSPIDPDLPFLHVCIRKNPRVQVTDFVQALEEGFSRHGVTSEVFSGKPPTHCEFILDYTALRSWDISPYLSHAELWITQKNRRVASAIYHLEGKGGLSLMKWESTKVKMGPVIDRLFAPEEDAK
ncbi:MAG: Sbal_3080 family lipoprotein [Zoogloeaceae bacterium]|nr:Sbal_3080 family lipoprotein [Zoogloeaceae bacterium]